MVRYSILAVAFAILGAEAGPCRPTTVTSVAEASSTIASDTTVTTTTTEEPACVETQVVVNPGFDDSDSSKSPWFGDGSLTTDDPTTAPNAISFVFSNGVGNAHISQTLTNLDGTYRLAYKWGVFSGVSADGFACSITPKIGDNTLRSVYPDDYIGWTPARQIWSSAGNVVAEADLSLVLECNGEYGQLTINVDDITLTKLCGPQAN
ncbi:hypothetical protein FNYG_04385 [Fusarium nygamai]|uniref:CBM-cenC domain-containing protein n=1 Tax=Gibberella nygamai TaxID=42673 RepID=A0A2K0WIS9_GIBNY|nr:hypothetical protein FNYG_04385 [Fusarium nygamai]